MTFQNLIEIPGKVHALCSNFTGQPFVGTPTFLIYSSAGELRATQAEAVPVHIVESCIEKENPK